MPKGIALGAVILVLSAYNIFELNVVLQLAVMIMIYSIVLSFILDFYHRPFLAAEAPLVHHRVHAHPPVLLVVGREVLEGATHAEGLDALHEGRAHLA